MLLSDHLRTVRGRWPLLALAIVVAAGLVWVTTPRGPQPEPPRFEITGYTASHTLIQDSGVSPAGGFMNLTLLAALAERGDIPRRVVERLGLEEEPAVVASMVEVQPEDDIGMITVSTTDEDGEYAARLANTFAEEIVAYARERSETLTVSAIETARETLAHQRRRVDELNERLARLPDEHPDVDLLRVERDAVLGAYGQTLGRVQQLAANQANPGLVTLSEAVPVPTVARTGEGIQPPRDLPGRLALAVVVAVVLGAALALLLERVDPRVRSRRQAEEVLGLPVVAELARHSRVVAVCARLLGRTVSTRSATAPVVFNRLRLDVLRRVRWVLRAAPGSGTGDVEERAVARPPADRSQVVLVTSAVSREDRTGTVAGLASSFAAAGRRVAVIESEEVRSEIEQSLAGPVPRKKRRSALAGRNDNPPVVARVAAPRLAEAVRRRRSTGEVLIVDAGPLLLASTAADLVPDVDVVLLVAEVGRTSLVDADLAREELAALQAPVLGVVLAGVGDGLAPTRAGYRFDRGTHVPARPPPVVAAPAAPSDGNGHRRETDGDTAPRTEERVGTWSGRRRRP